MINKLLKAKHWQIFFLTCGIPFIFQIFITQSMISGFGNNENSGSEFILTYRVFFPIMMILFMATFFGWFWSIAIGLQKVIPDDLKLKVSRFKIFMVTPIVYMLFFLSFFISPFVPGGINPIAFSVIIPLHLFSMFCIFYCMYFVAKTFKTAELLRKVSFGDFAGEFFMIWFFPIGIWVIQPKVNKMIKDF